MWTNVKLYWMEQLKNIALLSRSLYVNAVSTTCFYSAYTHVLAQVVDGYAYSHHIWYFGKCTMHWALVNTNSSTFVVCLILMTDQ